MPLQNFKKQLKLNDIKQLTRALRKSGQCQLLTAALEGNECEPGAMFQTICQDAMNLNDHHVENAGSEENRHWS